MKLKRVVILRLTLMAMVVFATSLAEAQTSAAGPYYPTPSWDQKLPASTRFVVLSNWANAAVLDRETGLVCQKSPAPDATLEPSWFTAPYFCSTLTVANRMGWRIPALQELASLVDPSVSGPGPTLPSGHPFQNVQAGGYWSATTHAEFSDLSRVVSFYDGSVVNGNKNGRSNVWCVRGGPGLDAQ